jgi:cysteine desulfurase
MRSGTLAPHLVVGLGEASRLALAEMESDSIHIKKLNKKLIKGL